MVGAEYAGKDVEPDGGVWVATTVQTPVDEYVNTFPPLLVEQPAVLLDVETTT